MQHLMIDIETLDTKPSSIVLSIGGCLFNSTPCGLNIGECIYLELDTKRQEEVGRTLSLDTVLFWSQQSPGLEQLKSQNNPIENSLEDLRHFIVRNQVTDVWSKPPHFDLVILESLFSDFGIDFPPKFRSWRDVNTVQLIRKGLHMPKIEFIGTQHHALDDAQHQARIVGNTLLQLGVDF